MRAVEVFQNRLGRTGTMRSILPLGKSTTHCHMIFFFSWKYDRLWIIHMCNYTLWKTSSRELDACLTVYSSMHLNLNSDELHFFFGFFCILPHFFCVAANTAVNQLCPLMTSELTVHGLKHSLVKSVPELMTNNREGSGSRGPLDDASLMPRWSRREAPPSLID